MTNHLLSTWNKALNQLVLNIYFCAYKLKPAILTPKNKHISIKTIAFDLSV